MSNEEPKIDIKYINRMKKSTHRIIEGLQKFLDTVDDLIKSNEIAVVQMHIVKLGYLEAMLQYFETSQNQALYTGMLIGKSAIPDGTFIAITDKDILDMKNSMHVYENNPLICKAHDALSDNEKLEILEREMEKLKRMK